MIVVEPYADSVKITGYQIELKPVGKEDLDLLLTWRNSVPIRQRMINDAVISREDHYAWYQRLQRDLSQRHWLVSYKGRPIGSTNVRTRKSGLAVTEAAQLEPGLYIGEERFQGNLIAFAPTLALYDYCFGELNIQSMVAVIKAENTAALKYNLQLGYQTIRQQDWVEMSLQSSCYQRHNENIKKLLSRPRRTASKGTE
ncbi:GNAT family N-acetyltransferase [Alteromonas sp. ASW11-19]|uniref:GNAT family N-acetyltransferase n=1 Tax=Alteromonas salexigens TaxID=2982530 RepID=A0ABT2VNV4_9ALTE|nr:GNAT family N-acetyltransferase [Alteromonas salexigens]MCU7554990.1 GNAT family N-acetyltransferase [Alteromonas salexigens]